MYWAMAISRPPPISSAVAVPEDSTASVQWSIEPRLKRGSTQRIRHTVWYGSLVSAARDRWLTEGLAVLEAEGAAGVRIDRLAARLGLSKGSFHHHFDGAGGFKRELLAHFERLSIGALDTAIHDAGTPEDARGILANLIELIRPGGGSVYRPRLDLAVRAWSTWDPDVRAVQARIDEARLSALQRVWRPHTKSDEEARVAALLPYLIAVGATVVVPTVEAEELRSVYQILLPLVPEGTVEAAD